MDKNVIVDKTFQDLVYIIIVTHYIELDTYIFHSLKWIQRH